MSESIVQIQDLCTHLGEHWIHEDLNLEIFEREIFAIVGGSGSGKSVLLRVLLNLIKPFSGTVKIFGESYTDTPEKIVSIRKRIGVLFQKGALFSSLTVLQNVMFPLRVQTKISESFMQELALIKLKLVGLEEDVAHKFPATLSGGMVKRVALARAMILDPKLLLLDEPTAGLDPVSAADIDKLILHLRDTLNLTIIIVTHDIDTLWQATDRAAYLGQGHVLAVGPLSELIDSGHPSVSAYFTGPRGRAAYYAKEK